MWPCPLGEATPYLLSLPISRFSEIPLSLRGKRNLLQCIKLESEKRSSLFSIKLLEKLNTNTNNFKGLSCSKHTKSSVFITLRIEPYRAFCLRGYSDLDLVSATLTLLVSLGLLQALCLPALTPSPSCCHCTGGPRGLCAPKSNQTPTGLCSQ